LPTETKALTCEESCSSAKKVCGRPIHLAKNSRDKRPVCLMHSLGPG